MTAWNRRLSLRSRVTLAVTALAAVALTAGAALGLDRIEQALIDDQRNSAEALLDDFFGNLETGGLGDPFADQPDAARVIFFDDDGTELSDPEFTQIFIGSTTDFVIESDPFTPLDVPIEEVLPAGVLPGEFEVPSGEVIELSNGPDAIVVARQIEFGDTPVTVAVSNPLRPVTDSVSALTRAAWFAIPLLIAAMGMASWMIVGRALKPVATITSHVDRIRNENLHERVPGQSRRDEIGRLSETMNAMLARLDRANRTQRQFISDASHELRSPITATLATLEVAQAQPDETDWVEVSDALLSEQRRLADLVDDLLVLARLDETGDVEHTVDVDLEELAIAEAERPHPVPVNVKVVSPARVTGDPLTLMRVLRNVIDNAARHASTRVDVTIRRSDSEAIVDVSDDGQGVSATDHAVLFDRFTRADDDRSRAQGGAGLGLAIAHRIVANHGGTIVCESVAGRGATFTIRLPLP